jgi:hypothetical protein
MKKKYTLTLTKTEYEGIRTLIAHTFDHPGKEYLRDEIGRVSLWVSAAQFNALHKLAATFQVKGRSDSTSMGRAEPEYGGTKEEEGH